MTAASRSPATALWRARVASGLLYPSYTINRDTTPARIAMTRTRRRTERDACGASVAVGFAAARCACVSVASPS